MRADRTIPKGILGRDDAARKGKIYSAFRDNGLAINFNTGKSLHADWIMVGYIVPTI